MTWLLSAFADEAGGSTDEQIAALQRGHIKHTDPRMVDGHNIVDLPVDAAKACKQKLDAAGITVAMYGSPIGKIDIADDFEPELQKLEHLAKMKDVFGATDVRMFSYFNKQGASHDQWREQSIDRLKRLRDKAGQLGLVLYHENESHIFGDKSDDVAALAELRDGETFKLIYDFANYTRTGEDGWSIWQKLKDQTDCFHFKDQKNNGQHVPMGQGDSDAVRIVSDAVSAGWSGPCTLEPHLAFSDAVLATGASGTGDLSLKDMDRADVFQVAAEAAHSFLKQCGVSDYD
jgi:sugar phosphate isomerase/epimerase